MRRIYILLLFLSMGLSIGWGIVLHVGVCDNYPLMYYDKNTKTAEGMFPDILKYAAMKNGWKLVYVYGEWKDVFKKLKEGKIDVLPDVGYSKDREKYIKYSSVTITNNWGVLYKRKGSGENAFNIFNLEGKKVALVNNIYYTYLKNEARNFNVKIDFVITDTYAQALKSLEDSKVDFAVVNRYYGLGNASKFRGIEKTNYIFSPIQLRFTFKKDIDNKIISSFDNILNNLIKDENSYYYEIVKKYATEFKAKTILPEWFLTAVFVGIFIGVSLLIIIFILRTVIKVKTREIRKVNEELLNKHEELEKSYEEVQALNKELESSYAELDRYVTTLNRIYSIVAKINYKNVNMEEISNDLLRLALESIEEADTGSISIKEGDHWKFLATVGHDKDALNAINLPAKYFIMPKKATIIRNIDEKNASMMPRELWERFEAAVTPVKHTLIAPIKIGDNIQGNLAVDISKEGKNFSPNSFKAIKAIAAIGSSFLTMNNYAKLQGELQKDVILSLIRIMEIFDPYTEGHSEFVAEYSSHLAQFIGLPKDMVKKIYWAGLLHDIGKVGVPIGVLNKNGKLTKEEYDLIKQHPVLGFDLLSKSRKLQELAKIVRHHHERYDGKGYPDGIKGEHIPMESRIITVVDTWHAMRSDRPYRNALEFDIALQEIKNGMGTQFDPEIAQTFLEMVKRGYKGIK